jgi:hypothetical protein
MSGTTLPLRARPRVKESITDAFYQRLWASKASDRVVRRGSHWGNAMNSTTYFQTPP